MVDTSFRVHCKVDIFITIAHCTVLKIFKGDGLIYISIQNECKCVLCGSILSSPLISLKAIDTVIYDVRHCYFILQITLVKLKVVGRFIFISGIWVFSYT